MNTKKAIRIALIGPPALILLLVIAAIVTLRSHTFTRFLLTKIVHQAELSTGARITIQKLDLRWAPFTADFYGVIVHGQEKSYEPPLMQPDPMGGSLALPPLLTNPSHLNP